jgi:hypothetical protein
MTAQWMAFRQPWMIEIVRCVARHPQLLHDTPGSDVGGNRERHQFFQPVRVKCSPSDLPSALRRKPPAPVAGRESPSDLDARREMRGKPWDRQANETDERVVLTQLRRAESKAVLLKISLDLVHQEVALLRRKRPGEKLHDARVGIQPGKGLPIGFAPLPKNQPLGFRYNHASTARSNQYQTPLTHSNGEKKRALQA